MAAKLAVQETADARDWDRRIWACPGANIYCGSAWGAYKARRGLEVRRAFVSGDGADLAFIQWQTRRKGPVRFIHVQGGPLLTEAGAHRAEAVFAAFIDHLALGRLDILAIDYEQFESQDATLALLIHGFTPVIGARDHTLELDLRQDLDAIQAGMEPRWRKALRKAERNTDVTTHFLEDRAERLSAFDDFTAMFAALRQRKGFATTLQPQAYRDIAAEDEHLLFLDVREKGERILVRIAHLSETRCTDFYTASNERARATSAATLAVWRFVERAKAEGCRVFDFGGIDPAANRPVFDFKRGLCTNVVQHNPLWVYGMSPALRKLAPVLLSLR
ncbi:Acetyltransferase (GNAT) domain-containing protein [Methylobacterium sp. UNC378MF]|uniref:lipid II:glycine glycyltransferase FemX n=1 Tax=Methylobacterium sp. UNC378MF TaxID=1502748 RepID=UPI0008909B66|nr:GNAT family N-acetyltransferase [Methylobacterium sp. UNC378MF]SDA32186.1 Acetyltransferase (GNAT) domain-containing protein [Methylobacterium sp. UNC378MF]